MWYSLTWNIIWPNWNEEHATTWVILENIMSQHNKKSQIHIAQFLLYEMFRLGYSIKTENGLETGARGEQGATANTYRTSFGGD